MQITVPRPTPITAAAIRLTLPDRYDGEDYTDFPEGAPGYDGKRFVCTIDLDTKTVQDWPAASAFYLHTKVCDEGVYELLDEAGTVIATTDGYVPSCVPGEYGDYVILNIDDEGRIADWTPDAADIVETFFTTDNE